MTPAERALLLAVAKSPMVLNHAPELHDLIAAVEAEADDATIRREYEAMLGTGGPMAAPSDEDRAIKYIRDNERHFAADARYLLSKAAPQSEPAVICGQPNAAQEEALMRGWAARRNGVTTEEQEIADRFDAKGRLYAEGFRAGLERAAEIADEARWYLTYPMDPKATYHKDVSTLIRAEKEKTE